MYRIRRVANLHVKYYSLIIVQVFTPGHVSSGKRCKCSSAHSAVSPRTPHSAHGQPWPAQWIQRARLLPSSPAARRWLHRPPVPAGKGTSGKAPAECCSSGRWSPCTVRAKRARWEVLGLGKSISVFSTGCFWWGENKAKVQNGACFWWENYYRYTFVPHCLWVIRES